MTEPAPEQRLRGFLIRFLCAISSGCLLFLSCADFDIWPFTWFAFLPLLLSVRSLAPRRAFWWGWLCGVVANGGGFYWITHLLMRFGHLHWLPSFALFALMMAYQGLLFGVFTWLVRRVQRRWPSWPMTLVAPVLMTALELVVPFIFPWYLAITQAWVVPVIQVADLAGPLGVTFLLLLANGALYDLVAGRLAGDGWRWRPASVAVAVLALALGYGGVRMAQYDRRWQQEPKVKVGIVQANVGIVEKGRAALASTHMQLHIDESRELIRKGAELLVWPESSYPYYFWRDMQRDWPKGDPREVMRGLDVPLLFGTLTRGEGDRFPYNSAYMMEPDGRITGRFDKNFLLVFGEYIPFYDHIPWFKDYFPEAGQFARGTEVTTFPFRSYRLAPLICYEDIIPAFGRRLAPLKPHLLVNITNDAWFGATSEPWEHMALSVYRAVELRTGLVRAVNTGVSVVIDARGQVLANTKPVDPALTPGVGPESLLHDVALIEGGGTVYAVVGDLFGYLNLIAALGLFIWSRQPSGKTPVPASGKKRRRRGKADRASGSG